MGMSYNKLERPPERQRACQIFLHRDLYPQKRVLEGMWLKKEWTPGELT